MVGNLVVEIAIYDFDLFHSTQLGIVICRTLIRQKKFEKKANKQNPDHEAELFADKS